MSKTDMTLTGKAKEDFEKWYNENAIEIKYTINEDGEKQTFRINWNDLYEYADSMKYGVFVDWFASDQVKIIAEYSRSQGKNQDYHQPGVLQKIFMKQPNLSCPNN